MTDERTRDGCCRRAIHACPFLDSLFVNFRRARPGIPLQAGKKDCSIDAPKKKPRAKCSVAAHYRREAQRHALIGGEWPRAPRAQAARHRGGAASTHTERLFDLVRRRIYQ